MHSDFSEFNEDFIPLLEKCVYNDGSLKQSSLENAVKYMDIDPQVLGGCLKSSLS